MNADTFKIRRFVVAGINGQFGRVLARKLISSGASICGIDVQSSATEPSLCDRYICSSIANLTEAAMQEIADSDYVLLCLPEHVILEALPRLCEIMRDDSLLIDIASVKSRIRDTLLKIGARVGYLSIHPMFGPMDDFSEQSIGLVPMYENPRLRSFMGMIPAWGASTIELTADQHDTLTAFVQALPHAAIMAFGSTLVRSGLTFEMLLKIATPIQKIMLALATRVVGGQRDTYWSIQTANPVAGIVRNELEEEIRAISDIAIKSNFDDFSLKLDAVQKFLSPSRQALEELADAFVARAKFKDPS